MFTSNPCGCGCGCPDTPQPTTNDKCLSTLQVAQIGTLTWIYGLNEQLCFRYQRVSDLIALKDCDGNSVPLTTQIVTCAQFSTKLCQSLNSLVSGGVATPEVTQLVGLSANGECRLFTIPPSSSPSTETPNTVTDTNSIDFSCSGTLCRNISGSVKLSTDVGNSLTIHSDGLYVATPTTPLTTCQQLSNISSGGELVPGVTQLVGKNCLSYTAPLPISYTVSDTPSLDLTLTGTNISGVVVFDPDTDLGSVSPQGLLFTCAEVLQCAPPVTVTDTSTVDLTLTGQNVQADVKVSATQGNNLSVNVDGLYVSVCGEIEDFTLAGPVQYGVTELVGVLNQQCFRFTIPTPNTYTVLDTNTIDFTLTGTVISGAVKLATPTDQLLKEVSGGLAVTCEDVQDCVWNISNNFFTYNDLANSVLFSPSVQVGNTLTTGTDGKPYVATTAISVVDSDCLNLSLTQPGNVITASLIISPDIGNSVRCTTNGLFADAVDINVSPGPPTSCGGILVSEVTPNHFEIQSFPIFSPDVGNIIECRTNGLYVPASVSNVVVQGQDSDCLVTTVTETPTDTFTVTVEPILSPDVGNVLECRGNGLFANSSVETVTGRDTNCITTVVLEGPAGTFSVGSAPILSGDAENIVECRGDGLYVPQTNVVALDTSCIDTTVTEGPLHTFTVSSVPILDPDPCNGLTCGPAGLLAPFNSDGNTNFAAGPTHTQFLAAGQVVNDPQFCINLSNPSPCRFALLTIYVQTPMVATNINIPPAFPYSLRVIVRRQANLPGFIVDGVPAVSNISHISGVAGENISNPASTQVLVYVVPPLFTGTFCLDTIIENLGGDLNAVISQTAVTASLITV